jgi:hypothetical protein
MTKGTQTALIVGLLLIAAAGAYYYWQSTNSANSP